MAALKVHLSHSSENLNVTVSLIHQNCSSLYKHNGMRSNHRLFLYIIAPNVFFSAAIHTGATECLGTRRWFKNMARGC